MLKLPGTIILGNEYQALGLLRQLHANGIKCILVDQDRLGPALLSRYRCKFYRSPRYESDKFWPWLKELAHNYGYAGWVIIPTDDEQVHQLAMHYREATNLFRYAGLPLDKYLHLYNKRLTYKWASDLGITVPRTFIPLKRDNFNGNGLSFPLIIKPAVKPRFTLCSKKKAIPVTSTNELRYTLLNKLGQVPIEDLLFQEIIPGGGECQWSYAGFFIDGEPIAAFTTCRRRQHPPDYGRASTYVLAIHDEEVEAESKKIIAELSYTGLAEVEWKRDPRDGKLKFLEVNARCWGWHSIASQVVGNLPMMLYNYLVNGTYHTVQPRYGTRWVKWITDIPVSVHLITRGEMSLLDYIRSINKNITCCEWDQGDPFPFFFQFFLLAYLLIKRGY